MMLHDLFGKHLPDFKASHWEAGEFVTRCTVCDRTMIKLAGADWRLRRPR
jgi:hypothetical protein